MIYDSIQEEGNIYTVLKNSSKKYVDNFEVIKGELFYFAQNEQEGKWAKEIGIKVSPYIVIDGELMSSNTNLDLMDEATGTIIIPQAVTKIGEGAFSNLEGLRTIVIPGTVKEIGMNAFKNNKTLEKVIIQEGVEKIGISAFESCSNLKTIEIPQSVTQIREYAMMYCENLESIVFPKNLKKLAIYLLEGCFKLKNVVLPENLEIIETAAFGRCYALETIELPPKLNDISVSAFTQCKLKEINTEKNNYFKYENGMLIRKEEQKIYFISEEVIKSSNEFSIPEGIESFQINLKQYGNITKITIPKSLTVFSDGNSLPATLQEIEIKDGNTKFFVENNVLYKRDDKDITLWYCYQKGKDIKLSDNVNTIAPYSFLGAQNAENITFPDSVTSIRSLLFGYGQNANIKTIYIGKNVTHIDPIFKYLNYQGTVTIDPENRTYKIKDDIIYSYDGKKIVCVLKRITGKFVLDSDVEVIGTQAFHNQGDMTEIVLNSKLKEIGASFQFCNGLTKIEIPSNVEKISEEAFYSAKNLKEVIIHKEKDSIPGAPWRNDHGLRAIIWKP